MIKKRKAGRRNCTNKIAVDPIDSHGVRSAAFLAWVNGEAQISDAGLATNRLDLMGGIFVPRVIADDQHRVFELAARGGNLVTDRPGRFEGNGHRECRLISCTDLIDD